MYVGAKLLLRQAPTHPGICEVYHKVIFDYFD
jgi:hypothetical protein